MAHLTCVAHRRDELLELVEDYRRAGIENLLALGGDPPADGSDVPGELTYANELGTVTVKGLTNSEFAVLINSGTDKFISVVAAGGVRAVLQIRGDNILEIAKI
jgi:hypothetical protein